MRQKTGYWRFCDLSLQILDSFDDKTRHVIIFLLLSLLIFCSSFHSAQNSQITSKGAQKFSPDKKNYTFTYATTDNTFPFFIPPVANLIEIPV